VLRGGGELFVPLAGVIDLDRERDRLSREIERLNGLLRQTEQRLSNASFVERAPGDVVEREREKSASYRDQSDRLTAKLAALR
jgi:valyl-tRNA synthetase